MFTITLTPQQVQAVINALSEMPLKMSFETFTVIQEQLRVQNRPAVVDKEAAD